MKPCIAICICALLPLMACSNGDLCSRLLADTQKFAAEYTCGDGGAFTLGTDAGAELAQCRLNLAKCSPSDQAKLSNEFGCMEGLPAYQCKWMTEGTAALSDPSFLAYYAQFTTCENITLDSGISATCSAALGTSTVSGSSGSSGSSGNPTNWAGTYTASMGYVYDGIGTSPPIPSGTETLSQTGTSVSGADFGAPTFTSCALTFQASGSTQADLSTQTCGAWRFSAGSYADLSLTTPQQISVYVNGSDPDGGQFTLDYTLTKN